MTGRGDSIGLMGTLMIYMYETLNILKVSYLLMKLALIVVILTNIYECTLNSLNISVYYTFLKQVSYILHIISQFILLVYGLEQNPWLRNPYR